MTNSGVLPRIPNPSRSRKKINSMPNRPPNNRPSVSRHSDSMPSITPSSTTNIGTSMPCISPRYTKSHTLESFMNVYNIIPSCENKGIHNNCKWLIYNGNFYYQTKTNSINSINMTSLDVNKYLHHI